jgi:hypothetical protein
MGVEIPQKQVVGDSVEPLRHCRTADCSPLHDQGAAHEPASGVNAPRGSRESGAYKCVVPVQPQTV